jgi:hypothetical protein
MPTKDELVEWANKQAGVLELDMTWRPGDYSGGWWEAAPTVKPKIRARAIAALAFLEQFSGSDSQWTIRAHGAFDNNGERQSMESGARSLSDILRAWVTPGLMQSRMELSSPVESRHKAPA